MRASENTPWNREEDGVIPVRAGRRGSDEGKIRGLA
jgi:hypothetical protein